MNDNDKPKYPHIKAQLTGKDGNAFAVLSTVQRALREGGVDKHELDEFWNQATSGDYNHLLSTCMEWVTVN